MLTITQQTNGNLALSIDNESDRAELKDELQTKSELQVYADLLEQFQANGSYTNLSSDVFSFGLTSDPYILVEECTFEDDGSVTVYGGMWNYPDYMINSVIEKLVAGETVILTQFYHTGGDGERLTPMGEKFPLTCDEAQLN